MMPPMTDRGHSDALKVPESGGQERCSQSAVESIVAGLDPDEHLDRELVRGVKTGWYETRRRELQG